MPKPAVDERTFLEGGAGLRVPARPWRPPARSAPQEMCGMYWIKTHVAEDNRHQRDGSIPTLLEARPWISEGDTSRVHLPMAHESRSQGP